MVTKLLLLITICSLFSQISAKLYQVVSLTRHGARYHVNDFGDGDDTRPLWGELTAVGMRQHQKLGQLFRKKYIEQLAFLSPNYNSSELQVYSTPVNRTLLSIQSQLLGLYPAGTGPRIPFIDHSLHLPPYSNKTNIAQQNYALPHAHQPIRIKQNQKIMLSDCPNYNKFSTANMQRNTEALAQMNVTYYPFFRKLAPLFNFSLANTTLYTMLRVWDVINVDNYLGRPLPTGLTAQDQTNVLHLANYYMNIAELDNISLMYSSGKLQKVMQVFDIRVRIPNSYPLKWSFLSGHDTDITALYLQMNLTSYTCVQEIYRKGKTAALNCQTGANSFAASLIFQLHSDNQVDFYVKLLSNGKYVNLCGKQKKQCDYLDFKATYKKGISSNISDLCGKVVKDQQKYILTRVESEESDSGFQEYLQDRLDQKNGSVQLLEK